MFVSSNRWARHDQQLSLCVKSDSIIISHFSHRFLCFLLQKGKKLGDKSAARFRILILSAEMLCDLLPSYTFNHVAPFLWVHASTSPPPFQTGFMKSIHSIFVQILQGEWIQMIMMHHLLQRKSRSVMYLLHHFVLKRKSRSMAYLLHQSFASRKIRICDVPVASFASKKIQSYEWSICHLILI